MPIQENIIQGKTVEYDGVVDLKDLINVMNNWFSSFRYDVDEEKNLIKKTGNIRSGVMEWKIQRALDDYHKLGWKIKIQLKDCKEAVIKGKRLLKGKVSIKLSRAYLERDYEKKWVLSPWKRFTRGVYDLFIIKPKEDKLKQELLHDLDDFFREMKIYFKS